MASAVGPDIIADGLVLSIDPASLRTNPSSGGTALNNFAGNSGIGGTVINGTTSADIVTLDGTNDYITIAGSVTNAELSPASATFSIWFRAHAGSFSCSNICSLISRGNYNNSGGFFIHMQRGGSGQCTVSATFSYSPSSSYTFQGTNYYIANPFGEWNNATVTVDSNIKLYLNGVLKQTVARSYTEIMYGNGTINTNGDTDLRFCTALSYAPTLNQGVGGSWRPFNGDFGLGLMYNKVLTGDEVIQNYNAQKKRFI